MQKHNKERNKKKNLLPIFAVIGIVPLTTSIVTSTSSCNCSTPGSAEYIPSIDESCSSDAEVEKKELKSDGSYEIVIKNKKAAYLITDISKIKLGEKELTKTTDYTFDTSTLTIIINKQALSTSTSKNIVITPYFSEDFTKLKLTLIFDKNNVTYLGSISTSDIKVDACKDDGSVVLENLAWGTEYILKINDTIITNFGGDGYKFESIGDVNLTVSFKKNSHILSASEEFSVNHTTTSFASVEAEQINKTKDFADTDTKKEIEFISNIGIGKYVKDVVSVKKGSQTLASSEYSITKSNNGTVKLTLTDDAMAYIGNLVVTPSTTAKTIVLTETTLPLGSTDTSRIHATATPATEKITWSSSDESVVTVDSEGYVQAKTVTAESTATITASIDGASATCGITVQPTAKTNYLKLETTSNAQITWTKTSTISDDSFSYCTSNPAVAGNWTKVTSSITAPIEFSSSQPLYLKGTLTGGQTFGTIKIDPKTTNDGPCVTLSGNLMNLLQDSSGNPATDLTGYSSAFSELFKGSTGLKAISQDDGRFLPCTTLVASCYKSMFSECTSLESVPTNLLPAATLSDSGYQDMFNGCTNLKNVPNLPATTLSAYCYLRMFYGCTSLETLPTNLLPANNVAHHCYSSMFRECTGLKSLPSDLLPADTLYTAIGCYSGMFLGCTGLKSLPSDLLPATTLASSCYERMFQGCTGLETLPTDLLQAQTTASSCYLYMFAGCTSLKNVVNLPANTLFDSCYGGMYYNCTSLTSLPSDLLSATTLAPACYNGMFRDCTNLKNVPTLIGAANKKSCYYMMFNGCTNLKISQGDPSKTSQGQIFNLTEIGGDDDHAVYEMFTGTSGSFQGTPVVNYTYYWYIEEE